MNRYMMATKATHALGDVSSEKPDICCITGEDAENYIGHWAYGFRSINLQFQKATTRELTPQEKRENKSVIAGIGKNRGHKIEIT